MKYNTINGYSIVVYSSQLYKSLAFGYCGASNSGTEAAGNRERRNNISNLLFPNGNIIFLTVYLPLPNLFTNT